MDSIKRILCISAYLPGGGGVERVILHLYSELLSLGYRLELCILSKPSQPDWYGRAGIEGRVYDLFSADGTSFHKDVLRYQPSIIRVMRSEIKKRWDVVLFTHTFLGLPLLLSTLAQDRQPILFWPLGTLLNIERNAFTIIKKVYLWSNCSFADGYLAVSSDVFTQCRGLFPRKKHALVYNPCEKEIHHFVNPSTDGITRFLYINRLEDKQKNISFLFRGLSRLLKKGRTAWRLTIIGDGPSRQMLVQLSERLGLKDHLEWRGFLSPLWEHVHCADCLLLTSRAEGLPLILGEAINRGCPVIASDCSGTNDIVVPDVNGWIFHQEDLEGFVDLLERFMDGHIRCVNKQKMKMSMDKFQPVNVARSFVRLFKEMDLGVRS